MASSSSQSASSYGAASQGGIITALQGNNNRVNGFSNGAQSALMGPANSNKSNILAITSAHNRQQLQSPNQTPPIKEQYLQQPKASTFGNQKRESMSAGGAIEAISDLINVGTKTQSSSYQQQAHYSQYNSDSNTYFFPPSQSKMMNATGGLMGSGIGAINGQGGAAGSIETPLLKLVKEQNNSKGKVMGMHSANGSMLSTSQPLSSYDISGSQKMLQNSSFYDNRSNQNNTNNINQNANNNMPSINTASLAYSSDNRNIANNASTAPQLGMRVKSLPKKSRSFGYPALVGHQQFSGQGQPQTGSPHLSSQQVQPLVMSGHGGSTVNSNNSSFYAQQQKNTQIVQQQQMSQYNPASNNKRFSADTTKHILQNSMLSGEKNVYNPASNIIIQNHLGTEPTHQSGVSFSVKQQNFSALHINADNLQSNLLTRKIDLKSPQSQKPTGITNSAQNVIQNNRSTALSNFQPKQLQMNQIQQQKQQYLRPTNDTSNQSNSTPLSNSINSINEHHREENGGTVMTNAQLNPVQRFKEEAAHTGQSMNSNMQQTISSNTSPIKQLASIGQSKAAESSSTIASGAVLFSQANFVDKIMIHVIDDSKNQKKDFTFSRSLLIKYMKYFEKCLKKISDNDEIDISIHCDAGIFEWLLNYIYAQELSQNGGRHPNGANKNLNSMSQGWQLIIQKCDENDSLPKLDLKNVVSILISADFLKIDLLINECMGFFVQNIDEISKVQVDMSCINSSIIREMAKQLKVGKLDCLKERKDKLVSRLFMKKLEVLLEKDKNYLHRCAYCLQLFTKSQRKLLSCEKGKPFINAHGQMKAKHLIDKEWDLKKFITYVRETYRISWKEIYWKVWSYLYIFKCDRCLDFYNISELGNCKYHTSELKQSTGIGSSNLSGQSKFEYNCCKQTVDIYEVLNNQGSCKGCHMKTHLTTVGLGLSADKQKKLLEKAAAHQLIILENPPQQSIEEVKIKNDHEPYQQTSPQKLLGLSMTSNNKNNSSSNSQLQAVTQIIKPSSLNYKISLKQAVIDYVKKETKLENFVVDVIVDDPQNQQTNQDAQSKANDAKNLSEEFDDVLFHFQVAINGRDLTKQQATTQPVAANQNKNGQGVQQISLQPQPKADENVQDSWKNENDRMKKKIEKTSINQIKYRVAFQQRQSITTDQIPSADQQQNDEQYNADETTGGSSPTKVGPKTLAGPAGGNNILNTPNLNQNGINQNNTVGGQNGFFPQQNYNQVQLTAEQIEEAKVITELKLRQFKKDRLQINDRDRMNQLQDLLKKTRLADSQLFVEGNDVGNGGDQSPSSPLKLNGASPRNNGGGGSPTHQKNNNMFGTPVINVNNAGSLGDKNTQVMTQISAIYNKRSRSSNNQGANSNANNNGGNSNQTQGNLANRNQQQQVVGGGAQGINANDKSPRVNRLKNYSPASREKPISQQNAQQPSNNNGAPSSMTGNAYSLLQSDERTSHSPTKLPNNQYANATTTSTFYSAAHRKINSNKLPQINSKAVEGTNQIN